MVAIAGIAPALNPKDFLIFIFPLSIFIFKKVGRIAEQFENLHVKMEGSEKQ